MSARLGPPKFESPAKGEYGFSCPGKPGSGGCASARDDKVKLFVNPSQDSFNCWVCGFGGRNLAPLMVRNSPELAEYVAGRPKKGRETLGFFYQNGQAATVRCDRLPLGFTPFGRNMPVTGAPYLSYLTNRGLSEEDVALYRIGYSDTGEYSGRVIVPSFDSYGMVNFFSARTIYHDVRPTYKLPDATKDIVSNEHTVDWTQPVYLVEGIFDEIAIGSQAIALYGKFLASALASRLVERRPPMVYVCLDSDARREARGLLTRLVGYDVPCALVNLPGKDPADLGHDAVEAAAQSARTVSGSADLMRERL